MASWVILLLLSCVIKKMIYILKKIDGIYILMFSDCGPGYRELLHTDANMSGKYTVSIFMFQDEASMFFQNDGYR
jgi:hypothetical protein